MSRWIRTLSVGIILATGASCRDDSNPSPTDPGTSGTETALATAATAPAFDQVSAGLMHTCGVAFDKQAYCWGWNVDGQFANTRPTPVRDMLRFQQISAGWYNGCGVTTDNRAYCWAREDLEPQPVPGDHQFRQVSTGQDHTCGVTLDNQAYCWGVNTVGQLGNGTSDPSGNSHPMPVAVVGGLTFREVSVGPYHSCGVTTTDRAYCWGGDRFGEMGDGSSHGNCSFGPCRKSPILIVGFRFRQIDAGGGLGPGEDGVGGQEGGRTCGVTTDNRAFCWGDGSHGQLGDGTRSISFSPRRVSGNLQFRRVSAGINVTCGVTMANRAFCWGDNLNAAVGDGTTRERRTPTAVATDLSFKEVTAGGFHTCATTIENVAYCWGANSEGQLGDGTTTRRYRPRKVVGPA